MAWWRSDMLKIQSLAVRYSDRPIVRDVTLTVSPGEVLALIGPNGAGKTTLIRAISGVVPLSAGAAFAGEHNLARMTTIERARCLAVVPQAHRLPAAYTVWQTVLLGRTPYLGWLGQPGKSDFEQVRWAMEATQTGELADRRIDELSGGEQQRVLLARALAQATPILLLDEPTSHLDLQHQANLLNLVRSLASRQRLAVLMALHDLNLVALYADRVALMAQGTPVALGSPAEVLTSERLSEVYRVALQVIPHPQYGTPLVLPDGRQACQSGPAG
jgi:iron complex transport system ATP-binding protein